MRKPLILALAVILSVLAISLNLPDSGITGFFVKIGITGMSLAKEVVKTVLNFIVKLLG